MRMYKMRYPKFLLNLKRLCVMWLMLCGGVKWIGLRSEMCSLEKKIAIVAHIVRYEKKYFNSLYLISVYETVVKYVIACLEKMPCHFFFSYFSKI